MNGLIEWAKAVKGVKMYFINHGEAVSADSFAQKLRDELGAKAYAPYSGAEIDLITGEITVDALPMPIEKKVNTANNNIYYNDLLMASDRLYQLIKSSSGRANADMRKLAEKINKLCDKWEL